MRRPLVATCSSDGSLRLWNYQDRSCELVSACVRAKGLDARIRVDARMGGWLCWSVCLYVGARVPESSMAERQEKGLPAKAVRLLLTPALPQVKRFEAEPLSLALHPTGYMLLVGFADKLRLLSVLADDLRWVVQAALCNGEVCIPVIAASSRSSRWLQK